MHCAFEALRYSIMGSVSLHATVPPARQEVVQLHCTTAGDTNRVVLLSGPAWRHTGHCTSQAQPDNLTTVIVGIYEVPAGASAMAACLVLICQAQPGSRQEAAVMHSPAWGFVRLIR